MKRAVRNAVGSPDNSMFIRRCIFYGVILAVMLFGAPSIFEKLMVPMAADGMKTAWYAVFVPVAMGMMVIGLFRSWRRRWPLAYMRRYESQARACYYETCPRCGSRLVEKQRTRSSREKIGKKITTTTYSDGSKNVNEEDLYGNVSRVEHYHQCTNSRCALVPDQSISQSHLPWKTREIECLVTNNDSLLTRKRSSASQLLLSRLLVPFLALVIIVVGVITIYSYGDMHSAEWTYTTADREPERSAENYQSYLMSLDSENLNWHITYEKESADMLSYLGEKFLNKDRSVGYSVGCYAGKDGNAWCYSFEGYDAGTGIPDGDYTLAKVDGVDVLIDDENKMIYKQGTEFYETYAPKLLALTHDKALGAIIDRVKGGEHSMSGTNDFWMEFVRKDNTMLYSYMLSQDFSKISGGECRAVTTYPDDHEIELWIFSYSNEEFNPVDLEGYVYSDAVPQNENDELGQLIKKSSDGTGSYSLNRNGETVLDIDIRNHANGYGFEIDGVKAGFELAFEEDAAYIINTNQKTLTKIVTDDEYNETESDMPLSQYQEEYDFLLSILPDAYIRRIIDMDKAEVTSEKAGLIKNYVMKDENGDITAEMKVAFGVIGEVIHHISENEYAKIELSY